MNMKRMNAGVCDAQEELSVRGKLYHRRSNITKGIKHSFKFEKVDKSYLLTIYVKLSLK